MADEKYPQQQFIEPMPKPTPMDRVKGDKRDTLEYETNLALMEAEMVAKRPRDRCNVGYEAIKASFRR
jgi:hypothetical protein